MEDDLAAARLPRVPRQRLLSGLALVRLTTGALCVAFVATGVALHTIRMLRHHAFPTFNTALAAQVQVLGLLAIVMTVGTLALGFSYARGLTARLGVDPERARAVCVTLAVSTVVTIGLHVWAAAPEFNLSTAELLIPFLWPAPGGFPYPVAAGIIGLWLIVLGGLAYFTRGRSGGHGRWRVLRRLALFGVALGVLHMVLLNGWIPGWGVG
jgi:hypothetical protein